VTTLPTSFAVGSFSSFCFVRFRSALSPHPKQRGQL
jgi:hypothetical protein